MPGTVLLESHVATAVLQYVGGGQFSFMAIDECWTSVYKNLYGTSTSVARREYTKSQMLEILDSTAPHDFQVQDCVPSFLSECSVSKYVSRRPDTLLSLDFASIVAKNGTLDYLQLCLNTESKLSFLHGQKCMLAGLDMEAFGWACHVGNVEMVEWLVANFSVNFPDYLFTRACDGGSVNVLEFLQTHYLFSYETFEEMVKSAIIHCQVDVLEYLAYRSGYANDWDNYATKARSSADFEEAIYSVISRGDGQAVSTMEWFRSKQILCVETKRQFLDFAVSLCSKSMVKYIQECGGASVNVSKALATADGEYLEWLFTEIECQEMNQYFFMKAACHGNIKAVEWGISKGIMCTPGAANLARFKGFYVIECRLIDYMNQNS